MSETVVSVENLYKSFGKNMVLKDVSFSCNAGEIVGFVGYNGCGKSVLFKCICGFLKPDSGTVRVHFPEPKELTEPVGTVGILIEEPAFLRHKSGIKNLDFLFRIRNPGDSYYMKSIMKKVGLDPENRQPVGKYSLGMKQRLAIAQAIMEAPRLLILDEPMNGLDRHGVEQMRQLFLDLRDRGMAILLASHSREDIEVLCDRVYEMDEGRFLLARERAGKS